MNHSRLNIDTCDRHHRFDFLRPIVRYVDDQLAVLDLQFALLPALPPSDPGVGACVQLHVEVRGGDSFTDEHRIEVRLADGHGVGRVEIVHPQRWWPAGLGGQDLYDLPVSLYVNNRWCDRRTLRLGLTSVRPPRTTEITGERLAPTFVVNGWPLDLSNVVAVDRIDESRLLPVSSDALLLVRDHYGPDLLYNAADQAGILLVQCVPVHAQARPERDVRAQVNRLSRHPSLAGWFVGHLGEISDLLAGELRRLDPARSVFRRLPGVG